MPISSVCTYPGCNALIPRASGRCEKHPYPPRRDARKAAGQRGYDGRWQRLRAWYIKAHPLCELRVRCAGAPAVDVDHIQSLANGGARLDEWNLQSVCRACHRWKTVHADTWAG